MGCRALIGVLNADGTVTYIYVHFEGHMCRTGALLLRHYNTSAAVGALMAGGDARQLKAPCEADPMQYYKDCPARTCATFEAYKALREENMYLFYDRFEVWWGRAAMWDVCRWEPRSKFWDMTAAEQENLADGAAEDGIETWVPLTAQLCGIPERAIGGREPHYDA